MTCVECDSQAIGVPMITGTPLVLWCNDHLGVAREASILRLGRQTHDFIFSVVEHRVWFWEPDIRNALQAGLDTFFEAVAMNLYHDENFVSGAEDLIRTKATELEGVIKFSQQDDHTIKNILLLWLTPGYISDIDGPLGKDTMAFVEKTGKRHMSPIVAEILTCMTLAAKRASSYTGHDNSAALIAVERAIWESHKNTLAQISA